jgi:hypothetical protein
MRALSWEENVPFCLQKRDLKGTQWGAWSECAPLGQRQHLLVSGVYFTVYRHASLTTSPEENPSKFHHLHANSTPFSIHSTNSVQIQSAVSKRRSTPDRTGCITYWHEEIVAFTLWTNSISWESCQVTIHNWNSQWSQVSILYQNIEALYICPHMLVPFSCGTKSQLVSFSLDLKNCIHFSVQFTWILCLVWWNLQVLDR